jgi:hypothetical protein
VVTDEIASTSHVTPSSKEPVGDHSKDDGEKTTAEPDQAAAKPDDEAEKALERIGSEIEEKLSDKVEENAAGDKSQHTETELLQSIIETAKAADLDVVEGGETDEISHVKKLEHEIEKIDAPQVEAMAAEATAIVDETLKVDQTVVEAASPKREREADDVEDSAQQEMVEQSPKKAKLDIEEPVGHDNLDVGEQVSKKEEVEGEVSAEAPIAAAPPVEEAPVASVLEDVTDSSSSSSSVEAGGQESAETTDGCSKDEQQPATDDKGADESAAFAISEPEVKEGAGVDRTAVAPEVEEAKAEEPIPESGE